MKKLIGLVLFIAVSPLIVFADNVKRNESQAVQYATDGDTGPHVAVDRYANQMCSLQAGTSAATNPIVIEDTANPGSQAGVPVLVVRRNGTTSQTGSDGDFGNPGMDLDGRFYVNVDGAGIGEWFQSCGTATASTSDTAIKAAVASNRMYVRTIVCKNTSATVGTTIDFKDGATVVAVGGVSSVQATAPGSFYASFWPPLRGSTNTAFNFATNAAVTSATCCITGFTSTN